MNLEQLILETEEYISQTEEELKTSPHQYVQQCLDMAFTIKKELEKMAQDEQYRFPNWLMRSCIDSFDIYSDYWKQGVMKYQDEHPERFEEFSMR